MERSCSICGRSALGGASGGWGVIGGQQTCSSCLRKMYGDDDVVMRNNTSQTIKLTVEYGDGKKTVIKLSDGLVTSIVSEGFIDTRSDSGGSYYVKGGRE